jgi:glyoxylase-like metal-dependent hydrolase (beta-lactamase superfamily II)
VADAGAAPPDFREAFLELVDGLAVPDAEDLRLAAMSLPGRAARERRPAPGSGEPPGLAHAGDLLVRAAPAQGIGYTAVVLGDPEPPAALEARGVALERAGPGLYVEVAEVPAQGGPVRTVGRRLTDRFGRMPRGQTVLPAGSIAYGEDDPPPVTDPDTNPFAAWEAEQDSLILLVGDDKLFILSPSRVGVVTPPARLRNIDWRQVVLRQDLGPLLGLPAVGAGGSRVFRAGPRLAVMLDAGRNPQRQPAAMYLPQLAATARDLNVAEVRAVILIHRHTDHFNELPAVVQQYGITAANVIMPQAYAVQETTRDYTNTVNALRRTFGANWRPARLTLRPATPAGDLLRGRYSLGELSFEFLADRAALRERRHADAASLLTRVTRRGDPGAIVVLGDLRGADLETFHNRMGPQAWREFFRNVEVIDGFSHHRGRLERADVPGIMRLLEATLLRTGRLVVTLQTDPGQHVQARADTLEFMRRIGVEVREVHVAGTAQPSGVRATTRGATAAGPHAQTHAPVPSALVDAVGRIGRLSAARETLVLWGPHIARQNPAFNQTAELRQIDQSLDELRRAVRGSVEAAARVRVSGGRTASGAQDYTSGTAGAAFVASLRGLPGTTPAETAIGPAGFAQIARMQRIPAREVPLFVALNDALVNGRYSREAFRYMVSQLDPAARRSIFTGPRGGPRAPHAVFRRLRAEFGFRQMLPGGLSVPSAAHLRPGARGAARGVAGALAVIEIGNLVAQGVQSYRIAQATAHRRNIAPFLRRLAFWRQLGVLSAAVAVDDPTLGSTTYERDPARIDTGLANGDWDFLYIEHTAQRPALSDAEILKVIAVLGHMIRNYDEYASLFEDSRQDAMRHVVTPGQPWWGSRWEVRVGNFSTSGTNHVAERWQELPLLGEGMNAIVRRVVANTTELLNRIGRGESAETEALGTLQHPRGRVQYRARLRPGVATPVELRVAVPGQWGSGGSVRKIFHRVAWQTASRPEFFVWHVDGVDALVSGADFATYHRLRDLESEEYEIGTRGITLNALYSRKTGNQDGHAWMHTTDLERI